jgi:NAD(P)-dependent dehydrogenase (short-subunit alcohol dehydrogenase family)
MTTKVALITGASSGIGHATALELKDAGYTVYGAARRVDRMASLTEAGIHVLALDVTDEESVKRAIATIEKDQGRIDLLVNNAGYGSYGALEDVPLSEGRAQFDVNIFGVMLLCQLVIPIMRAQGSGRIVNVSSIGGKIYTPFGAWYHGTKFALEGMSDAMRTELKQFGIDVVVIEPGAIKTEWAGIAMDKLKETSGKGAYAATVDRVTKTMGGEGMERRASDPSVVAKTIARAATVRRPKTRYAVGSGAKPILMARRLVSDRVFDSLIARVIR